jgi:cysteine synthase
MLYDDISQAIGNTPLVRINKINNSTNRILSLALKIGLLYLC